MVCKKEVIAWFRDLSAYRRIDFLCALMDCCGPLELRFLGAYVEELGRKDFDSLRECELNANDISYISKLTNISDIRILDKVLTSLALMNSKCQEGARVLFTTLKDHTDTILNGGRTTTTTTGDSLPSETHGKVVLLAVMALNHPAFTFSQKQALRTQLSALLQAVEGQTCDEVMVNSRPEDENYEVAIADPPLIELDGEFDVSQCAVIQQQVVPLEIPITSNTQESTEEMIQTKQESVFIKNIEVKGLKKRAADKRYEYTFQVHWSNGTVSSVSKTHAHLFDFQCKLLNLFPEEGSDQTSQDRVIPYLPGKRIFSTAHKGELAEKTLPEIVEYAKQLSALPQHILECEHTVTFFQPPPDPTTGAPVYTNTAQSSQLVQTQAAIMPNQTLDTSKQPLSSPGSPHTNMSSTDDITNLTAADAEDTTAQIAMEETNQQQLQQHQHVEQQLQHQQVQQQQQSAVDQLHQQPPPPHIPGPLSAQQVQQQQQAITLSTSLSQMQISHHHPVSVSTPTPTPPTMSAPVVSCVHTSMVTTTSVTTAAGSNNAQYYPPINNIASMPRLQIPLSSATPPNNPQINATPGLLNSTEQYNIAVSGSNDQVPGLQQYKLPGTRLPYKPNSWPIYSQPNMAPPGHSTSPFVLPSPHMCVSGLHSSPRYFPTSMPLYPPQRDHVVPPIQEWLKKQRLHKYAYHFEGMTVQQVLHLTDEEIDSWNIVMGAKGRIKTQLQALRNGFNGVSPQLVATSLASAGPAGGQQQQTQQQQAYMAQLQAAGYAAATSYASAMAAGLPPGMLYTHPLSSGEGTGSECSSAPSSPRESSDENDRDSEGSESSVMSSPEARPVMNKDISDPTKVAPPPSQPALGPLGGQRMAQGSPRPPLANIPYMVQSPTGEVIPLALALGGRGADGLMMQGPPPPARQMDVRLPGLHGTPDGSSPVLEMQTPPPQIPPPQQQKGCNGGGAGMNGGSSPHLSTLPTSSSLPMVPRQLPVMSMSDSSIGMASGVPNLGGGVPPTMDLATQMMHMTGGSSAKSTLPSPQYTPVEEPAYNSNTGVPTGGSVPVLSNSATSMQMQLPILSNSGTSLPMQQQRTDNAMSGTPNHMMNAQSGVQQQGMQLDHSRTMSYAPPPTSQAPPNFVVNPLQPAPTAVTYVTTTSHHSHSATLPPNNTPAFDTATSMPFNNNQSAYNNPNTSNNSALCTSCGCNGQCGDTSGGPHHGPPHFPPTFSSAYLPNQLAFQQNFNPNFFHPGNVLPPTPTNNVMNSPMQQSGGTPAGSPRYPSPMPPSPFQNMMPGEMPPAYGGGNGGFHNLVPPAMYLGAMGLASAGQRTNHMPSTHPIMQSKKTSLITCYNCGARGHRQIDCQEATMESITHNSQYRLNFKPLPEHNDNNS